MMAAFVVLVAIPAKWPDDTSAQGNGKNGNGSECSESTWQLHVTPHVEVDIASTLDRRASLALASITAVKPT